jgi:hypothetical protein
MKSFAAELLYVTVQLGLRNRDGQHPFDCPDDCSVNHSKPPGSSQPSLHQQRCR